MRDPERIDPFLAELAEFWKERPDWRFGQVIMNLSREESGLAFSDIWEWDTEEFKHKWREWDDETEELREASRVQELLRALGFPD